MGGAWSDANWAYKNSNWFNTLGPEVVIRNFAIEGGGFVGGGQTGFNFQSGAWVFGVEGSVAATDLDGSIRSPFFPEADSYRADVGWLASVTGRMAMLGVAGSLTAKGDGLGRRLSSTCSTKLRQYEQNPALGPMATPLAEVLNMRCSTAFLSELITPIPT